MVDSLVRRKLARMSKRMAVAAVLDAPNVLVHRRKIRALNRAEAEVTG
jgi:hypothetical protein